jgi:ribosomal protein S18 acetylase RimI-like enzyme
MGASRSYNCAATASMDGYEGATFATVDIISLDLSDEPTASELLELQRRAYQVEAVLIGSDEIPPLRETLAELQASGETFLGMRLSGALVGAISWRSDGETIDLHRLVVDPAHFRTGVGSALIRCAVGAVPGARQAVVQTGAANEPALALYRREGFAETEQLEPLPGLRVTRFTKRLR